MVQAPRYFGGEITLGVIDLQQMTPKGENALEGLHYTQIASAALRARDITNELSAIVEKDSLTNRCSQPLIALMTSSQHLYKVRPHKDHRGVDLISDALPG